MIRCWQLPPIQTCLFPRKACFGVKAAFARGTEGMETEAAQQPTETVASAAPPTEVSETNPPFSPRWIETEADQKLNEELYFEAFGYLPY